MSWIKRNLFFVIGSAVALVLMGLAGWFLYTNWNLNNEKKTAVNTLLEQVKKFNGERPHPGVPGGAVNNITNAQDQIRQLREFIAKTRSCFTPVHPIPNTPKIEDQAFSRGLSATIKGLQDLASKNSVSLPQGYYFSFEAMKTKVNFAPGSLARVAVQLGEVKMISEVLLHAQINSLVSLRRERVSADDLGGPQTDYLSEKTVTNDLAIVTPYEVTFTCFSEPLATVLGALATSPNGVMVKTIEVSPAPSADSPDNPNPGSAVSTSSPILVPPTTTTGPVDPRAAALAAEQRYADNYRRYGLTPPSLGSGPSTGAGAGNTRRQMAASSNTKPPGANQPTPPPSPKPPPTTQPFRPGVAPPPAKPAMQTVLDEKLLTVTIGLNLIKQLPPK